jgi:Na+/melibiose symporter-like transporter
VRATWRVLVDHRDLRLVLSAGLISQSGDWILLVGLLYHVYAITGSTVASALTLVCSLVPQALFSPVAGVFVDRWDRKATMIIADLLLAAGLVPLLAVHGAGQVWIVFAVVAWEGTVEIFFTPAQQALVPRLVPDDRLVAANVLTGQVSDISRLAGSGLGGVIAATGGLSAVTLADAASFVASAMLLAFVRASGRPERAVPAGHATATELETAATRRVRAVAAELRDGLGLALRHPFLRALLAFGLVTSLGEGILLTLFAPFVRSVLHGSNADFGLVTAAQAVGGIVGGLFAVQLSQRVPAIKLFIYGAIAFGFIDLAIFLYPLGYAALWPAVVGMILVGLPSAVNMAALITLFQRSTRDSYRGRVFGALGACVSVATLAGAVAAGYLGRTVGIVPVLAVQGAGYVLAGVGMAVWLRSSGWSADTPAPEASAASPAVGVDAANC